jgi:hypothetical protein
MVLAPLVSPHLQGAWADFRFSHGADSLAGFGKGEQVTAIVSLLLVISVSILITRIATVLLTLTGLSREAARFQARSALSGTGFTTSEAEKVVSHPVRRRIILLLMLVGNAGIITAVSALILGFVGHQGEASRWVKVGCLAGGVTLLWGLAHSQWVDRRLSHLIEWALKRYTKVDVRDYTSLMHLGGEYRIAELLVEPNDWLADQTLAQSRLRDEGIVVLGIEQADGTYIGAPKSGRRILSGDLLLLYGRHAALQQLDDRKAGAHGTAEHRQAVAEQKKVVEAQEEERRAA